MNICKSWIKPLRTWRSSAYGLTLLCDLPTTFFSATLPFVQLVVSCNIVVSFHSILGAAFGPKLYLSIKISNVCINDLTSVCTNFLLYYSRTLKKAPKPKPYPGPWEWWKIFFSSWALENALRNKVKLVKWFHVFSLEGIFFMIPWKSKPRGNINYWLE